MGDVERGQGSTPYELLQRTRQRLADGHRRLEDPVATFESVCPDLQEFRAAMQPRVTHDPLMASAVDALGEVLGLCDGLVALINAHRAVEADDAVPSAAEPAAAPYPVYECGRPDAESFPVGGAGD